MHNMFVNDTLVSKESEVSMENAFGLRFAETVDDIFYEA